MTTELRPYCQLEKDCKARRRKDDGISNLLLIPGDGLPLGGGLFVWT